MRKFRNGHLFMALCLLAAWLGSTIETGRALSAVADYECRWWKCQGTEQGCILQSIGQEWISGCYDKAGKTCNTTVAMGICNGKDDMGNPCKAQWQDCSNPGPFPGGL